MLFPSHQTNSAAICQPQKSPTQTHAFLICQTILEEKYAVLFYETGNKRPISMLYIE